MRLKKALFIMTLFTAVCLVGSVASGENWSWYECDAVKMGVGGGRYIFTLSGTKMFPNMPGPASVNTYYEVHPSSIQLQKEILAIALTAVSLGKKVEVLLIPEITKSIYALYLKM
jgi:hypothetical protein